MAGPLTWREVSAPNFSGVADSQRLAAQLLSSGIGGLGDAVGKFRENRQNAADSTYLSGISQFTDAASLEAAHRAGIVPAGASAEAIKFGMQRQSDLIANHGSKLINTGRDIGNESDRFRLSTTQRDDAQAQDRLAAQPEAARLLAEVRTLASSGDPAKVELARSKISGGTQTLINAGYRADAIPGLLDAERAAGTAGFGYRKDLLENDKFWENQGISKAAQEHAFKQINANATPDVAIRSIQESTEIKDPRIKAQAIEMIQQSADNKVFAQATEAEKLLTSLSGAYGVPTAVPSGSGSSSSNPLVGLVDRTEGGGRYDTLFGHSQRAGGAFEGIDVSQMSLDQLSQLDQEYGPWVKNQLGKSGQEARIATPMGRFQIVGDTRRQVAQEMGLPGNTVFTPEVQNAMFEHLVDKRISGPRSMAGKIQGLRQEWEGFKSVPDNVLAQAINAYEKGDRSVLTGFTQNQGAAPAAGPASAASPVAAPGIAMPVGTSPATELLQASRPLSESLGGRTPSVLPDLQPEPAAPGPTPSFRETEEASMNTLRRDHNQLQNEIDMTRGQGASQAAAQAAQLAAAAQPVPVGATRTTQAAGSASSGSSEGTSLKGVQNDAQNLLDQSILDRVFNRNSGLINELVNNPNRNENATQTAARLVGEGGLMPGGNQQAVLQAINETIAMSGGKLTPSAAGALVANNAESRDLTSWWLPRFLEGDRFSSPNENKASATRTNMAGVTEDLKQLGLNVDGSIDLARGTSQIRNQRQSTVTAEQIPQMQALLLSASSEAANIMSAIERGQDTPANRAALKKAVATIEQLKAILDQVGAEPGSPTTIYSKAGEGLPTK